jgi:hypothetical protein
MKKFTNNLQAVFFGLFLISFYSCGTIPMDPYIVDTDRQRENSYHAPAVLHAPLMSQKNDLRLAAHYAFLTRHKGLDIQSAFSPIKHLGLQASYRHYSQKGEVEDGKIESYELGAGNVKEWGIFLFETYAGIGGGNLQNLHHTGQSDIRYTNYYIQPAIAIQTKDRLTQFALIAKLSPTKFDVRNTSFNRDREPFVASQIDILSRQPDRLFIEPGFVFRSGWDQVQVQTALSFPSNLRGDDFLRDKTNFSIGLVLRLNASSPVTEKR